MRPDAPPPHRPAGSRIWPHSCLLLALFSAAAMATVPMLERDGLLWQADGLVLRPWTLWTAALFDPARGQWLANLGLLMLLAICGASLRARRREALCLWLAWPLATLGLRCWPEVSGMVGLSGVTHAAGAILIVRAMAVHRPAAIVAAMVLCLKLIIEHAWHTPRLFSPDWNANVLHAVHLSGALTGAVLATLVQTRPRRARQR